MAKPNPTAIQLTAELIKKIDAVAAELSKRAGGVAVSRSAVMRLAIEKGLPLLLEQ